MVTELDHELPGIIARAQAGDSGAFTELYRRYASVILRFLYARTQEQEGAQDLTQEVFMRVLKGISNFEYRGEKSFLGWLYTIAGNVLVGHVRRKQPISTPLDEDLKLVDPYGQQAVLSLYDRLEIQEAMSQLTEDQQRVVTMKFFADMTNSEIATVIGRSEGAVKALQNRAITALSQIMKQDHSEPLQARELNGHHEHWESAGVAGAQLDGATSVASPIGAQARLTGNGAEREKRTPRL
ncbi:MAG TPA: sigma-70 family RNA polymerase sigma factor [Roseiflexaceae bacterium]|jgi:RNA polymerase sigma-70 factor (ECF subfamily)|nr:sigma-70 family RNA polymerase sigma factor [Roseiflexaceae bacterium]